MSSWIRLVSIGASGFSWATLAGREDGGVSCGFGCVRVKGSSTDKSLDTKIEEEKLYSTNQLK